MMESETLRNIFHYSNKYNGHTMNSITLIRSLSDTGADDFSSALQWLNPLPADANDFIKKIDVALTLVNFSQDRNTTTKTSNASNKHAESLMRLKTEIESILGKHQDEN